MQSNILYMSVHFHLNWMHFQVTCICPALKLQDKIRQHCSTRQKSATFSVASRHSSFKNEADYLLLFIFQFFLFFIFLFSTALEFVPTSPCFRKHSFSMNLGLLYSHKLYFSFGKPPSGVMIFRNAILVMCWQGNFASCCKVAKLTCFLKWCLDMLNHLIFYPIPVGRLVLLGQVFSRISCNTFWKMLKPLFYWTTLHRLLRLCTNIMSTQCFHWN